MQKTNKAKHPTHLFAHTQLMPTSIKAAMRQPVAHHFRAVHNTSCTKAARHVVKGTTFILMGKGSHFLLVLHFSFTEARRVTNQTAEQHYKRFCQLIRERRIFPPLATGGVREENKSHKHNQGFCDFALIHMIQFRHQKGPQVISVTQDQSLLLPPLLAFKHFSLKVSTFQLLLHLWQEPSAQT